VSPIDYSKKPSSGGSGGGDAPKVNLGKVTLSKRGQAVDLTKGAGGDIRVNLNWNQGAGEQPRKRGLFKRGPAGVDLDLGCLFEFETGDKGAVQALGNTFGDLHGPPWIKLDADDRTGQVAGGENMTISGRPGVPFRRVLVYAFIYQGAASWSQADGVVTITPPGGGQVEVALDEHADGQGMCAIALLQATGGGGLSVTREVQYFKGHLDMDRAYGWNMNWQPGRK